MNFYLEKALERAGLPKFRMHDIRHTFKVVQELMGHATVQMTLDTYTHVLPGMKTEAIGKLNEVFKADSEPSGTKKCSPEM